MKKSIVFCVCFTLFVFSATAWGQSCPMRKSFSWKGLYIYYPSNYTITNKGYDRQNKSYSFICTTTDEEIVSMATISFSKKLAKDLSTSLSRKAFFKEIIPAIVSELESGNGSFKSLNIGDIKEFPIPYSNVYTNYTAAVQGIEVQGKIVVFIQKDYIVSCIFTTDSSEYPQELDDIIKSIKVK